MVVARVTALLAVVVLGQTGRVEHGTVECEEGYCYLQGALSNISHLSAARITSMINPPQLSTYHKCYCSACSATPAG